MGSPGWHSLSPQHDERLHAVSLGDLSCRQKILAEAKKGLQGGSRGASMALSLASPPVWLVEGRKRTLGGLREHHGWTQESSALVCCVHAV